MSDTDQVVKAEPMLTEDFDSMREIESFADALQVLSDAGIEVESTEAYGDGFKVADKATLVGAPFIILGNKEVKGEYGTMTVLHAVCQDGRKVIIVDGSTGIHDQAANYRRIGKTSGLLVPEGLKASHYTYTDDKGKESPATTYYLT